MRLHAESGGVIVSGLLRTVAWLGLFCVLAFDTGGIVTNRVLLDEAARVAARHAAESVVVSTRAGESRSRAGRRAVEESLADQPGVQLVDVRLSTDGVEVTVRRRARVIVAGRIPPLRDMVHAETTARFSLDGAE